jgi:uncharacterized protein (DUF697 family)/tellurite resistance protein
MNKTDEEAIVAICLYAALADGERSEHERTHLRGVFDGLKSGGFPDVYTRVIARKTTLEAEVAKLSTPDVRRIAYEMAVCVCDADGIASDAENAFLAQLRKLCKLDPAETTAVERIAERLAPEAVLPATSAQASSARSGAAAASSAASSPSAPGASAASSAEPSLKTTVVPADAEVEKIISNAAILAGGLELLPDRLATLAIVPVQTKLVYDIGRRYGYELDAAHARELLAAVGVGMATQVVERFARGVLGGALRGVLGGVLGGALGGLAGEATGVATSFASTWAIGQVARRYYSQGRTMTSDDLREEFQRAVEKAKELQGRYGPEIEARARTIDVSKLFAGVLPK